MSSASIVQDQMMPYQRPVDEVLTAFGVQAHTGLSQSEAQSRLQKYGQNELTTEKPVPAWRKFFAQSDSATATI